LDTVISTALRELEPSRPEAIAIDGKTVRSTRCDEDHEQKLILFAALHTQRETARYLVQEKGADYLFTVKENQPELKKRIEALFPERLLSLSPSDDR
jgi:hypothetical protein